MQNQQLNSCDIDFVKLPDNTASSNEKIINPDGLLNLWTFRLNTRHWTHIILDNHSSID